MPPKAGTPNPIAFAVVHGKAVADAAPTASRPRPPAPAALAKPEISPTGERVRENEIRVRFSEPMVPIAAVGVSDKPIATIAPPIAGTWRWIDTRVATFTATAAYLPNATEVTVTVPAGTTSLAGSVLGEPAVEKFRTRPITLTGVFPKGTLRPDSPIAVQLDQDVDPDKILPFLRVIAGKQRIAVKTVTLADAEAQWRRNKSLGWDDTKHDSMRDLVPHFVLLAPVTAWPAGSQPRVALAAKAPSKEGPLLSEEEVYEQFSVAAPFTVRGVQCNDAPAPRMAGLACPMRSFLSVELSNPIDETSYRAAKIQLEGEPFDDHDTESGRVSMMVPDGIGRTVAIAIAGDLVDIYGQPLVGPRRPTFTVVKQRFDPYVSSPSGLQIIDPRWQIPQWIVEGEAVTAFHVQLFQAVPSDYLAYEAFERGERATPPGKKVLDKFYPVGARQGAVLRTDLRPHLGPKGTGHLIAVVHAQPAAPHKEWTPKTSAWLEVTRLGATARVDGEHLNAYVQDISPAAFLQPIANATATIVVEGRGEAPSATTDASGHVELALLGPGPKWTNVHRGPTTVLLVSTADDSMFTPFYGSHERAERRAEARWYVTDDRFMYKPGETVYVKGWVRWTHSGPNPDLALPATGDTIAYTLVDNRGSRIANGTVPVTAEGGFDLEVALPSNANLGTSTFTFQTKKMTYRHPIEIEEFRRPAYSVALNDDVTHSGATPLVLGESIEMQATAKYYAGGGLPGAHVTWSARFQAASYTPPGWSHFAFRPYLPDRNLRDAGYAAEREHVLSADSTTTAVFGVTSMVAARPSVLEVDATVTDVDRNVIRATSRPILVHPSTVYVGMRLQPRTTDVLELIVTDIDGNPVAGVPIDVAITARLGSERDRDDAAIVDTQHCTIQSATQPVTCRLTRKDIQYVYSALAKVEDARKRQSFTTMELPWYAWRDDTELSIVADKKSYRPGEVAKLDIHSKQVPGVAIVTYARQGVIAERRVELATPSTTVELPIEPGWLQNVHVLVDRITDRDYKAGTSKQPLPQHRSAQIDLPVELESARLVMRTRSTRPLVEPGAPATFEVEVTHDGKPTPNAEVALIVVDEAILALAGKNHDDPLAPFYRNVAHGTTQFQSFQHVRDDGAYLDGKPGFETYSLDEKGFGPGGGGTGWGTLGSGRYGTIGHGSGYGSGVVTARKDFRATAVFSPRLVTDEHGKVRVTVTMPDSLTRFRIVALATAETRYFGKAESAIVTQRKVNARTVAPRFLSQGDTFSLPVVVQNLDTEPRTIAVGARAANLVALGPAGKQITLQGGQRAEVRFDFQTKDRGKAVVQTIAVSGAFADASNMEIPVYEPATTESFATYGVVDGAPTFERLEVPADIFPDVGGVEVELASTQLQSLTDAYWYLYAYPYECAEQRSSRMIATSAIYDVLDAFAAPGRPTRQEIQATAIADIKKLAKDQRRDGGWGYFEGMRSDPFVTAQVLVALGAHASDVPPAVLAKAKAFVTAETTKVMATLEAAAAKPAIRRDNRATYAGPVSLAASLFSSLAAAHVDMRARAERLHVLATTLGAYPMDAKARLLALVAKLDRAAAMRRALLADLLSATHETAAGASVATSYEMGERAVLPSTTKTTALALDAIMREVPQHPLVEKLARGVLASREHGRWVSTQENLVVMQTMRRYFDTYEKDTPNYTGRLWFGAAAYTEQAFAGRSTVRGIAQVGWDRLPARTGHDLALQKDGTGRMYYRIGITYAPKATDLPPLDAGFLVRRSYTAIDDPADVQKLPDGRIQVRLGARVRVTVEAIASTQRYAVALVDPLPAGFEVVNDHLATAERVTTAHDDAQWDFRNARDNRMEVFMMDLTAGSHRYTYTARATTPGTFLAAPTKAEEMYSPETFGRSGGVTVVIR